MQELENQCDILIQQFMQVKDYINQQMQVQAGLRLPMGSVPQHTLVHSGSVQLIRMIYSLLLAVDIGMGHTLVMKVFGEAQMRELPGHADLTWMTVSMLFCIPQLLIVFMVLQAGELLLQGFTDLLITDGHGQRSQQVYLPRRRLIEFRLLFQLPYHQQFMP